MGSIAEIFLLRQAMAAGDTDAVEHIRNHIYAPHGGAGVIGVDAKLRRGDGKILRIDAKTFQTNCGRRFFAINDRKHRDIATDCDFYFCGLVPKFGSRMVITRLIPYDDVSAWECGGLMKDGKGTPSRNIGIGAFLETYATSKEPMRFLARARTFDERSVSAMADDPEVIAKMERMLPALPILSCQD